MRRRSAPSHPANNDVDSALAALSADALREVVREMLPQLDEKSRSGLISSMLQRAVRGATGWEPAALSGDDVAETLAFAKVAELVRRADPTEVDEHLRRASCAFLRKDYSVAQRMFGALLRPIGEGRIDLGQHEMVDEVLGADTTACAAQYVVATYMLSPPAARAAAVAAAIDDVRGFGHFWEPIRALECVAVEPLPGLDEFLPLWRALLGQKPADGRRLDWDTAEDRWLREVVQRMEGADGLAKIARTTKRADDLRAWCESLVDAGDWNGALSAFEEAAGMVAGNSYARGELLDGAALAAQHVGREDLSAWLERAWRAGPSMLRLRRWLGSAGSACVLRERASQALLTCPMPATRQRAFLHVLQGEFEAAAELLAAAPGLGWSNDEHPGHLLFPLFTRLLGGEYDANPPRAELEALTADQDEPRLAAPGVEELLEQAGVSTLSSPVSQRAVLAALRKAAERRLAGVTEQKRRHHYGHAAELVGACVSCAPSPGTARWVAALKAAYARFPALRAKLDQAVEAP